MLYRRLSSLLFPRGGSFATYRWNSVYTLPKRFYKDVSVADEDVNGETLYSVLLDKHQLKTLAGKVLKVSNFYP